MLVLQLSQPPHTLAATHIKEESHDISSSQATWGFPKIRGTLLGVPVIRTIVSGGLYWVNLILGNYHLYT